MILLYENAFSLIIYMFSTATILRLMENNTLIVIHDVYTVVCFVILWWTAIFESIVCLAGAILNGSPIVPITAQTRFFNYQLRSNLTIYLKRCITPIGRGMGTICLNRHRQNTKRHRQAAALKKRNGIFLITICIKIKTNGNVWGKKERRSLARQGYRMFCSSDLNSRKHRRWDIGEPTFSPALADS